MERPTGVTVISVLNFIGAAFYVLGALGVFMGGAFLAQMTGSSPQGGAGMTAMIAGLGAVLGVICLIGAGLCLLVGIGLWKLANWARILEIVLLALGLLFGLFGLFGALTNFHAGPLVWQVIFMAIQVCDHRLFVQAERETSLRSHFAIRSGDQSQGTLHRVKHKPRERLLSDSASRSRARYINVLLVLSEGASDHQQHRRANHQRGRPART